MKKQNVKKMNKKKSGKKQVLRSKNFWVIMIYLIFMLINHFALDSKAGVIWDKLKVRSLKLKQIFKR